MLMSVRQLIPEDLADIAPGPELARVQAGLELSRLSGFDCVEVLKATDGDGDDGEDNGDGDGEDNGDSGPYTEGPDSGGSDDREPDGGEQVAEGGGNESATDEPAGVGPADGTPEGDSAGCTAGAGLELRVRLSTLLGLDPYPAELAGWGFIHAELARDLATILGGAQWRFAATDKDGQLTHCGITRARPLGTLTRSAACRAIIELQVTSTALRDLAADPATLGDWAGVVADLAHQLAHDIPDEGRYDADADRRAPSAALRRYLEIRDRYCTMIGCRAPAHTADKDHTHDHAKGGATIGPNLGDACRHDHRLKGEGGWALQQPAPGVFRWTTVRV
jgi:hypothetical protein